MIESISMKLEKPDPFSKGMEELTLKKPPPFVPSCLIATSEAAGPRASVWCPPTSVLMVSGPLSVWITPWETRRIATITESGSRM